VYANEIVMHQCEQAIFKMFMTTARIGECKDDRRHDMRITRVEALVDADDEYESAPVGIMISKACMFEIQMVDEHSFAAVCTSIIVLRDCLPIESSYYCQESDELSTSRLGLGRHQSKVLSFPVFRAREDHERAAQIGVAVFPQAQCTGVVEKHMEFVWPFGRRLENPSSSSVRSVALLLGRSLGTVPGRELQRSR